MSLIRPIGRMSAVVVAVLIFAGAINSDALTPKEREKVQHAAAEQARIEADNANKVALLAAESAMTSETKAKLAEALEERQFKEFERAAKENAEMRKIVDQVSGPWWFPGLNALIYGIKKCALSLLVIIAGIVVLFIVVTLAVPGFRPAFGAVTGFLGRIFGSVGKGALSVIKRKSKAVEDNIEHRTIGSEPTE
jgi:hypothetical protein